MDTESNEDYSLGLCQLIMVMMIKLSTVLESTTNTQLHIDKKTCRSILMEKPLDLLFVSQYSYVFLVASNNVVTFFFFRCLDELLYRRPPVEMAVFILIRI
jgi:hypothetical protein